MAIYSGFTHWKWWFSIVMLVYQRVDSQSRRPFCLGVTLKKLMISVEGDGPFHPMIWACCNLTRQSQWQKDFTYYCPLKTHSTCISNLSSVVETPVFTCFYHVLWWGSSLAWLDVWGWAFLSPHCATGTRWPAKSSSDWSFSMRNEGFLDMFGQFWGTPGTPLCFLFHPWQGTSHVITFSFPSGFVATTGLLHGWMAGTFAVR